MPIVLITPLELYNALTEADAAEPFGIGFYISEALNMHSIVIDGELDLVKMADLLNGRKVSKYAVSRLP